jgi:5-formyltetrahydrofolate cyclo-ligase
MNEIVAAKQGLRQEIIAKRKLKITAGFTENLNKLVEALKPRRVAIYVSFGTEPSTLEFIEVCQIPVLVPITHEENLSWEQVNTKTPTELTSGDLLLIPALAIDKKGNRLGRGKGYFDRELKSLPKGIKVYAICYETEFLDELPTEDHDHPVDGLITEVAIRNLN